MYGYQRKFGRNEHPAAGPYEPHPPDDKICAQMCAIFGPIEIENLIHELMGDHPPPEPGHRYSWYVTVGLQRRRGIDPLVLKQARTKLRVERFAGRSLTGEQQTLEQQTLDQLSNPGLDANPQFRDQLLRRVAEQRKWKGAGR
jgi:hypothetical protein